MQLETAPAQLPKASTHPSSKSRLIATDRGTVCLVNIEASCLGLRSEATCKGSVSSLICPGPLFFNPLTNEKNGSGSRGRRFSSQAREASATRVHVPGRARRLTEARPCDEGRLPENFMSHLTRLQRPCVWSSSGSPWIEEWCSSLHPCVSLRPSHRERQAKNVQRFLV